MTDTTTPAPRLDRPTYHVWMTPDGDPDAEPDYVGVVTVRNVDQLTAEVQAKGLRIERSQAFHLANLWIWAAMVRLEMTTDKFHPFTQRMEYRPVEDDEEEVKPEDPTFTGPGPSTA